MSTSKESATDITNLLDTDDDRQPQIVTIKKTGEKGIVTRNRFMGNQSEKTYVVKLESGTKRILSYDDLVFIEYE